MKKRRMITLCDSYCISTRAESNAKGKKMYSVNITAMCYLVKYLYTGS